MPKFARENQRKLRFEPLEDRRLLSANFELLKDINPTLLTGVTNSVPQLQLNGVFYFSGTTPTSGSELWRSDGTPEGTWLVKDIWSGTSSSNPSKFIQIGDEFLFSANDGVHGPELWKSDGTTAGTVLVSDIRPSFDGSIVDSTVFVEAGGVFYFKAFDGSHGYELWKTDGTTAGTLLVKDIDTGSFSANPMQLTNVGGTLYFSANDGTGFELWKSDGTTLGTVRVADLRSGINIGSYPLNLTNVGGTLFFTANDGTRGAELWKSNGTAATTTLVKSIAPGSQSAFSTSTNFPPFLTNLNGTLYFAANDGATSGLELWRSDGTDAGTVQVIDIIPGAGGSNPVFMTAVGNELFFVAGTAAAGNELWASDGTAANTRLVLNIRPGSANAFDIFNAGNRPSLTNVSGVLYFVANDGTHGYELWKSDGTAAGTSMVANLATDSGLTPAALHLDS